MKKYKEVMFPILVPIGDYCLANHIICSYFNNEGGNCSCELEFYPLERDKRGRILKPKKCKLLKKE